MKIFFLLIFSLIILEAVSAQNYESYKKLKDTTLQSSYLGYGKDISIVVPLGWQASIPQKFPIVILFDKQNKLSNQYILSTIDYLTTNYQMPPVVVISVESTRQHRLAETWGNKEKGKAKENEQFIFDELIPYAEQNLHASSFRMLIGHSRYGFYTTSMFVKRINDLNAVIALSPFYEEENLKASIIDYNPINNQPVKYYRAGIESLHMDGFTYFENQINKNSINIKGTEFEHGEHHAIVGLTIAPALFDVFQFWAVEQDRYYEDTGFDPKQLDSITKNIKAHYGENLRLSLGVLNSKGWACFNRKDYEDAIEAWTLLLKDYPNFADAYSAIIAAQKELKIDTKETMRAFEKCIAESEYYTPEEKLELLKELE